MDSDTETHSNRHAVVIAYDRWNPWLMGCYGDDRRLTPHLDRFATGAIVFDKHHKEDCAPTADNHAWYTGCFQFPHSAPHQRNTLNIFETFSRQGVACEIVAEENAGDQREHPTSRAGLNRSENLRELTWGEDFLAAITAATRRRQSEPHAPTLLWISLGGLAPHHQSLESAADVGDLPSAESLSELVRESDRHLGEILAQLGNRENLLTIVTADGGIPTAEYCTTASDVTPVSFPLTISPLLIEPGGGTFGSRRQVLTQSTDLAATLADWFGLSAKFDCQGRSLLNIPPAEGREFVVSGCKSPGQSTAGLTAIRTFDFSLIQSPNSSPRLYLQPDDYWEINEQSSQYPDVVEELQATRDQFVRSTGPADDADYSPTPPEDSA